MAEPKKILIIQTAFIGDVILASALWEEIHEKFPDQKIDVLVRKGNESLVKNHPFIGEVLIWNKKEGKYKELFRLAKSIRSRKYDAVINLQRFASSGFLTWRSGAKEKIGFDKNPFSMFFTRKVKHEIGNGKHEVERNLALIAHWGCSEKRRPKLHPSIAQFEKVKPLKNGPFVTMAPSSVWFTKQLPEKKWVELCNSIPPEQKIYLLGAPSDLALCDRIKNSSHHEQIELLTGKLDLLESAALMKEATMNYVNDSAPLHLASAMNAPVTAFFCSTVPEFGFGPLSDQSIIKQTSEKLDCRPCGLHGKKACPKGHFKCGDIQV